MADQRFGFSCGQKCSFVNRFDFGQKFAESAYEQKQNSNNIRKCHKIKNNSNLLKTHLILFTLIQTTKISFEFFISPPKSHPQNCTFSSQFYLKIYNINENLNQ